MLKKVMQGELFERKLVAMKTMFIKVMLPYVARDRAFDVSAAVERFWHAFGFCKVDSYISMCT